MSYKCEKCGKEYENLDDVWYDMQSQDFICNTRIKNNICNGIIVDHNDITIKEEFPDIDHIELSAYTSLDEYNEIVDDVIRKIKDYDRLESDYSTILCHATCSQMSKTNYDTETAIFIIDEQQEKLHYGIIKSDIQAIFDNNETDEDDKLQEIQEYINQL